MGIGQSWLLVKNRKETVANITLLLGTLVLLVGAFQYNNAPKSSILAAPINTSVMQRYLAIEKAKKEGNSTYSFTTNFIPGIGVISDPKAYLQQRGIETNP